MEWFVAISDKLLRLIEIGAWPVVVLCALVWFKEPLRARIADLEEIDLRGNKLTFREKVKELEKKTALDDGPKIDFSSEVLRLVNEHPHLAIVDSWIELEQLLRSFAESRYGVSSKNLRNILREMFADNEEIHNAAEKLKALSTMRNMIVHGDYLEVNSGQAKVFLRNAESVKATLKKGLENG